MAEPSRPIDFSILCQHKDSAPSNLNQTFEKYGAEKLEAKVPVVDEDILDRLKTEDSNKQAYATMAFQSHSATSAVNGRFARVRNRQLKMVEIHGETILAAGKERDRSPVDEDELDHELELYMQARRRLAETNPKPKAIMPQQDLPKKKFLPAPPSVVDIEVDIDWD